MGLAQDLQDEIEYLEHKIRIRSAVRDQLVVRLEREENYPGELDGHRRHFDIVSAEIRDLERTKQRYESSLNGDVFNWDVALDLEGGLEEH